MRKVTNVQPDFFKKPGNFSPTRKFIIAPLGILATTGVNLTVNKGNTSTSTTYKQHSSHASPLNL